LWIATDAAMLVLNDEATETGDFDVLTMGEGLLDEVQGFFNELGCLLFSEVAIMSLYK
jgi:hypothetical protein